MVSSSKVTHCVLGSFQNLAGSPCCGTGNGQYWIALLGPATSHLQPGINRNNQINLVTSSNYKSLLNIICFLLSISLISLSLVKVDVTVVPKFGNQVVDKNKHFQLGKLIPWTRMRSIAKWHIRIGFWSNLHPPTTRKMNMEEYP